MRELLEKTDINYLHFGIAQALAWTGILLRYGVSTTGLIYGLFGSILVLISFIDAKTYIIPNELNLLILLIAVGTTLIWREPSIWSRIGGFFVISLPMLLIAMIVAGAFGGGDIKMMAASGFLLGLKVTAVAGFIGIVIGGCYGIYLLRIRKAGKGTQMPFGPSLCCGIYIALLYGETLANWYIGLL